MNGWQEIARCEQRDRERMALLKFAVIEILFVAGFWLWMIAAGYAQTAQTKPQLQTEQITNFPDNNSGLITPAITRTTMGDFIASWEQAGKVRAVSTTSDTLLNTDTGWLITYNNTSAVAVTLPQAGGNFLVWDAHLCNRSTGLVTITPTTSTIGGATTATLQLGQCAHIVSDSVNYQLAVYAPGQWVQNQGAPANCGLSASVATNILTVTLTDNNGNAPSVQSPCQIPFRSSTAATGQLVNRYATAATTITTFATGATLGSVNAQAFRFWVVAFDNGGTVVLSLYNAWSDTVTALNQALQCFPINEGVVQSSTAISGAATSAGVYYTPNGTTLSNLSIRILGYVEYNSSGLATAGTYATGPNFIQMFGPGVKRPCEPVQSVYFASTANTTVASGTPGPTVLTNAITPTSAANKVRVDLYGTANDNLAAGNTQVYVYRGTAACTTQLTGFTAVNSAGGSTTAPVNMFALDHANTAAAQNYTICLAQSSGNTASFPNPISTSQVAYLVLTELM